MAEAFDGNVIKAGPALTQAMRMCRDSACQPYKVSHSALD